MKAFNPTARAQEALDLQLVTPELHDSVFQKIAARAEIEPGSQQVLLGGIGSGKTTELLLTERALRDRKLQPIYIEASRYTDLAEAGPGSLVAMLGLELIERTKGDKDAQQAAKRVKAFANGEWVRGDWEPPDFDDGSVYLQGKLTSPLPVAVREVHTIKGSLSQLLEACRSGGEVVALFDDLDRLPDGGRFTNTVAPDLGLLKHLEISVVTVAPWSMRYEPGARLAEQFDKVHELRTEADDKRDEKLRSTLAKRDTLNLLSADAVPHICRVSGGVIRDLITLARDAGEEAYVDDSESIGRNHIAKASEDLGQSYSRGLSLSQINLLRDWKPATFDPTKPEMLDLLTSRRVLERANKTFQVHPALVSVLQ